MSRMSKQVMISGCSCGLDVNLKGIHLVLRAFLPAMIARPRNDRHLIEPVEWQPS